MDIDASPQLQRTLRKRHVEMIAIGGIIGAGLFVGSSTSIVTVGPAVILSYAAAGLIVIFVMRMLSEMAVAIPGVQSFPEFARHGLGHWAGFMSGWLYWYFWVVVVAIEAIAGAKIIHEWLPQFAVWQIGVALMAILTGVNLLSAKSYGEFEFWLSSIKVAAIIAFIVIALSYCLGFTGSNAATFGNLTAHGGFMPKGGIAVLGGITSVIFALVGAEIATIAAAESAESSNVIARMTATVALRILIFYILSIALIVSVVPWTNIEPGISPFATALAAIGVPAGATIMNAIVLVAVLSCLNSGLYVTSRVLFGLADKGDAPKWLVAVGPRSVPTRAILIGSLFAYGALAASVLSPEKVFVFLVNASGATMLVIYLMIAGAQLSLRNQLERQAPERLAIRMWFHPWGTICTSLAMIAVLAAMAIIPELASQFYASLVPIVVFGLAFLLVRRK
jgi:GABA permease